MINRRGKCALKLSTKFEDFIVQNRGFLFMCLNKLKHLYRLFYFNIVPFAHLVVRTVLEKPNAVMSGNIVFGFSLR